jgi:hypothetical protein
MSSVFRLASKKGKVNDESQKEVTKEETQESLRVLVTRGDMIPKSNGGRHQAYDVRMKRF